MRVVVKKPGEPAHARDISGTLESLQGIVGGYIESVVSVHQFSGSLLLLVYGNEEARLQDPPLPRNFHRPTDGQLILGTVVAVLIDEAGENVSMDDGAAARAVALFAAWAA